MAVQYFICNILGDVDRLLTFILDIKLIFITMLNKPIDMRLPLCLYVTVQWYGKICTLPHHKKSLHAVGCCERVIYARENNMHRLEKSKCTEASQYFVEVSYVISTVLYILVEHIICPSAK